jgi:hypothetical protein
VLGDSFRLWELYRPRGWGSELRATFGSADATWGSVMLLRERSRPGFTADEASFLASVSRHLGQGCVARCSPPMTSRPSKMLRVSSSLTSTISRSR